MVLLENVLMYGVVVEGQCVYKVRVFGCKRVMVLGRC